MSNTKTIEFSGSGANMPPVRPVLPTKSLRDEIAIAAMQTFLHKFTSAEIGMIPEMSYAMADIMLKERAK